MATRRRCTTRRTISMTKRFLTAYGFLWPLRKRVWHASRFRALPSVSVLDYAFRKPLAAPQP
ncbi:protein of unknown function (plasmid) [Cupriavidus taiwanensis]|uniref:Uncharacterized protein n=1 Tax=Cupriavidus taiwanensis TaxID=164546 RepID=A0A375ISA1_9BURK|nr:protein of unknown function [Cupriavidus taiwanensis]